MALEVFLSNQVEFLATLLAEHLADSPSPLTPELVVVQSRGMERFVAMTLAQELGVCAAVRFPYPAALVQELACRLRLPGAEAPLTATALLWRVLAALEAEPVGLPGDAPPRQRMAQALALTAVFQRYLLLRPQWLPRWEAGQRCGELPPRLHAAEDEQRQLWRRAAQGAEARHRAALALAMGQALEAASPQRLPHRVHVFGLSSAPPLFLDLLAALARHVPVRVYLLAPSPHAWGRRPSEEGSSAARLLARLGTTVRDFLDGLEERGTLVPVFAEPKAATLLDLLQADLLQLPEDPPVKDVPRQACHLEVHACPSPRREVEVLRERLLALLAADSSLEPHHILVVAADLATYAPLLHAVLGAGPQPRLPFAVADLPGETASPEARLLLDLLAAAASRLERSRVLELLAAAPTRAVLGLSDADLERLEGWLEEAGVAWGVDASFREGLGLPASATGTWRAGLTRLALGLATGETADLVAGVAPVAVGGAEERETLAACAAWLEDLERLAAWVRQPAPAWDEILPWVLATFFPADAEGLVPLRRAVAETIAAWQEAGCPAACAQSMAMALRHTLGAAEAEGGFLAHGITCCGPRPMRAVPFRVVAVLGLAAGVFPRTATPPAVDLAAALPRPGDRTPADDDRGLFLDLLLSARDHLLLLYPDDAGGQGRSPLLDALLEHLDGRATVDGAPPSQALVTVHPAQPFHPQALDATFPWPTHTPACLAEAQAWLAPKRPRPPLFRQPLPEVPLPPELDLDALAAALAHPCRALLRALGVAADLRAESPSDDEPCAAPRGLAAHRLKERLLPLALAGASQGDLVRAARAWQAIPDSPGAEALLADVLAHVTAVAAETRRLAPFGTHPKPAAVDLGGTLVHGGLPLGTEGIVLARPGRLRARDLLALHLAALTAGATGLAPQAVLVTEDGPLAMAAPPPAEAQARLAELVDLWGALHRRPLALLPRACLAYAQALTKGEDTAQQAMRETWETGPFPECQDPWLARCFPDGPPWDEAAALARRLLLPALAAPEAGRG